MCKIKIGTTVVFGNNDIKAVCTKLGEEGMFCGLLLLSFLWFLPVLMKTRVAHQRNVARQQELAADKKANNKSQASGKSSLTGS